VNDSASATLAATRPRIPMFMWRSVSRPTLSKS
jgi:hypothetical protein